jgi:hypothetical protein
LFPWSRIQSIVHQRIRTDSAGCYSGRNADTLLGFCPSRVCPATEIEWISPFFLSQAYPFGLPKRPERPASQSFANRRGRPSPKRRHPLLGFLTSFVFWQSKADLIRDYLILLGNLVAIANPMVSSLNQSPLTIHDFRHEVRQKVCLIIKI